jgi:hypothetical protein
MRILWTLIKVMIGLAIAIPLGIVALGVIGGLIGLAVVALKLACVAFVGYGLYRVARHLFAPAPKPTTQSYRELPMPDPYYEAAMREVDAHVGRTSSR